MHLYIKSMRVFIFTSLFINTLWLFLCVETVTINRNIHRIIVTVNRNKNNFLLSEKYLKKQRCYRRYKCEIARLSVFWERILRFSQAKILESFLWLSAKNFKSAFRICICSRTSVFSGIFVNNQIFYYLLTITVKIHYYFSNTTKRP